MYKILLISHNHTRWLVLASLLFTLYRAYQGYVSKSVFSKTDNSVRHWTATIAHLQLMIGMVLYFNSPLIKSFFSDLKEGLKSFDLFFFSLLHSTLMLIAIVLITIGSARAKRAQTDQAKFNTLLVWFSIALVIILLAIPWPFSPFATRPYLR